MSQSVRKWLILSAMTYFQAKIWIILLLHFLENLRKYVSAIYWQNYKLNFQPFIACGLDARIGIPNQIMKVAPYLP